MFQRGYGVSHVARKDKKHAQSTYLDEHLLFKKNLAQKFLLEKVLEHFEKFVPIVYIQGQIRVCRILAVL